MSSSGVVNLVQDGFIATLQVKHFSIITALLPQLCTASVMSFANVGCGLVQGYVLYLI